MTALSDVSKFGPNEINMFLVDPVNKELARVRPDNLGACFWMSSDAACCLLPAAFLFRVGLAAVRPRARCCSC